jgi:hypothetical protein
VAVVELLACLDEDPLVFVVRLLAEEKLLEALMARS